MLPGFGVSPILPYLSPKNGGSRGLNETSSGTQRLTEMTIAVVYSDELKGYDFGPGHPFRSDRYANFMKLT